MSAEFLDWGILAQRLNSRQKQQEESRQPIGNVGIWTTTQKKEEKVKMMPANGQPTTIRVESHELGLPPGMNGGQHVRGSQLDPAEVTPAVAKVLASKGWVPHEPYRPMTLEETQAGLPEKIHMMAPNRSSGTAMAEREDGTSGLYPCTPGEEIEVDPRDVGTLRAKGWGVVRHGTEFPAVAEPGERFRDDSTGNYYVRSAAGWEPQPVFFDDEEVA